jgi:hypothetical protein
MAPSLAWAPWWPPAWCQRKKASAIALMFSGLTLATLLGVPAGAWIGQHFGWRMAFAAVAAIGVMAFAILVAFVPRDQGRPAVPPLQQELAVLRNPQVWLGLGITVFGFAGCLRSTPISSRCSRRSPTWTQPGGTDAAAVWSRPGAGNLLGGKLADRGDARPGAEHCHAGRGAGRRPLGLWPAAPWPWFMWCCWARWPLPPWPPCRCACCSRPARKVPTWRPA